IRHEGTGHQPRPLVCSRDKFQRRLPRDRIHGRPHRTVLKTVDVVIGLILVPGSSRAGIRFLHQKVVMVKTNTLGFHQLPGYFANLAFEYQLMIMRIILPVAEILKEETRITGSTGDLCAWTRRCDIVVNAVASRLNLLGAEETSDAYDSIALESGDIRFTNRR